MLQTNWIKLNKLGRVQTTILKVCEPAGHRQVSDKIDVMEFDHIALSTKLRGQPYDLQNDLLAAHLE